MLKRAIFFALAAAVLSASWGIVPTVSAADAPQGKDVMIHAILLSQASLKSGDVLGIAVFWKDGDIKGKTDGFSLNVAVTDKMGRLCADPIVKAGPFENGMTEMLLAASADCDSLMVKAALIDPWGKIVNSKLVSLPRAAAGMENAAPKPDTTQQVSVVAEKDLFWKAGLVIALVLLVIGCVTIVAVRVRGERLGNRVFFFIIIMGGASLLSGAFVAKAQFDLVFPEMDIVLLDKYSYAGGETATISVQAWGCAFDWQEYPQNVDIAISLGGSGFVQMVGPQESYRMSRPSNLTCNPPTATKSFVVPSAAGVYNLVVRTAIDAGIVPYPMVFPAVGPSFDSATYPDFSGATYTISGGYVFWNIPIAVTTSSAVINGACGLSNGGVYAVAPVSDLCATGVASAVSDFGYWSWQCVGSGGGATADCSATKPVPAAPTIDLKVNSSDGPITLASGATKNLSWTATNATSCTASGVDAFTGSKSVPNGSETLTVSRTSTDVLTCTGPGGTASDSVQINATCTPSTGAWGACDCSTETKTRTNINASCLPWTESDVCTIDEKNSCRDFNWKEVAP